jgi:hypothetical protein
MHVIHYRSLKAEKEVLLMPSPVHVLLKILLNAKLIQMYASFSCYKSQT